MVGTGRHRSRPPGGEQGSAAAEFVMVGALLTVLTLAVMQLGIALLVRNTVLDAAAEGARYAALADSGLGEGAARTRELITASIGPAYATDVEATYGDFGGFPSVQVRVVAPLPLLALFGVDRGLEVVGHAAVESLR
ncbi:MULTISPECIES: TadE family protein [Cryobacterium]|uniref:Pilus assembly protein n=1 Tax=Cryobacterium breve TaxID=1259258 RepID=A0ABY2J647_9MICO|nr:MULTISPECIES: TadE family protein [Cryobacterium]TFC95146.1 pilus assembly protein [Cryobacterium sp. TmT3-12]TFD00398.1 pilus assembly protein [Cryobacterium breve]